MSKIKIKYVCTECSFVAAKWLGKCPECNNWNTLEEELQIDVIKQKTSVSKIRLENKKYPEKISEIKSLELVRLKTGLHEFDRVMGGGITKDSLTLVCGEPGVGKSTLIMEICKGLSMNSSILYVSGEESIEQVAGRAKRLGIITDNLYIFNENCWQEILIQIEELNTNILIIDSIQTVFSSDVNTTAGSMSQVREVTFELMNYAKSQGLTVIIIGHITKDGLIAGPKVLEHMVDTVINFSRCGSDNSRQLRISKNRFGNTSEIGLFEMSSNGIRDSKFLKVYNLCESQRKSMYGRSLSFSSQLSRCSFLEIQSLVVENKYGNGKRVTQGIDTGRLSLLLAIIDKYYEIPLSLSDIYLNIIGGTKFSCRENDLAIIASLLSSQSKKEIDVKTVFLGEVGLCGEVRSELKNIESTLRELKRFGIKRLITSGYIGKIKSAPEIEVVSIDTVIELKQLI